MPRWFEWDGPAHYSGCSIVAEEELVKCEQRKVEVAVACVDQPDWKPAPQVPMENRK